MSQQTSALWDRIFRMRGTTRQYMFDIAGTVYGPESEISHSVSGGLYEEFGIGNASSAKLTISLYAENIPRAAVIKRYIRIRNADAGLVSEWIPKGIFFTNRRSEDDGLWTVDAFDAMRRAERVWVPSESLTFPLPMTEAVTEFARLLGVEVDPRTKINPNYSIPEYPYDEDYTIRDELRFIAAAHGGNWTITDTGKLLLVPLFSAPVGKGYLVTEHGAPIVLGHTKILVGSGEGVQSAAAAGCFKSHYAWLDLTGLRKNSVQRPVSRVTLSAYDFHGNETVQPGYTRLEYIESTGTQYIDAGFYPSSKTEVAADFGISSKYVSYAGMFGARDGTNQNAFCTWLNTDSFRDDYYTQVNNFTQGHVGRKSILKKANTTTIGSETVNHGAADFQCNSNFLIFSLTSGGAVDNRMLTAKLYSFKVSENGVLIRNFIPAKDPSGVAGLYDLVNGVFYENYGTGEFIAGPEIVEDASKSAKTSVIYSAGDDTGMEISAECPYGTQEMVDAILGDIGGGKYEMYNADDVNVDPAMELGDGITLGNIYSVIARVDDDGSGWPSLSQPGKTELEDEFPYKSEEKRKREVLENKVEKIEEKIDDIQEIIDNFDGGSIDGVLSFNERKGHVVPQVGDYTDEISEAIRYAIYASWEAEY